MTKARDLANIISGGFTFEDIPNIPASKITSGTLDAARIPSLDATKLHDGSISNTEFGYLNNVSSAIQTQIDGKISPTSSNTLTNKTVDISANTFTVDGTDAVGFRNTPISSKSADYTLVMADSGKTIYHPASDNNTRTFTIPAHASVAFPIGTVVTFVNLAAANLSIAITSDTMNLAADGTTGTRTLAQYGVATVIKLENTNWFIGGNNIS